MDKFITTKAKEDFMTKDEQLFQKTGAHIVIAERGGKLIRGDYHTLITLMTDLVLFIAERRYKHPRDCLNDLVKEVTHQLTDDPAGKILLELAGMAANKKKVR